MKRILELVIGLGLLVSVLTIAPALAGECGIRADGTPIPCPDGDADAGGISYRFDSEDRVFYENRTVPDGQEEAPDADGVVRVWQTHYIPACTTGPAGQVGCFEQPCEVDGRPGTLHMVYRRLTDTDDWQFWADRGLVCMASGADPITIGDVRAEIIRIMEMHFKNVAEPEITVAPAVNAVVNLPVLASTPDPGPLGFDITNPIPGRVEATPSYQWTWSSGEQSSGAGVAYDGTSPTGSPGHYPVTSTYRTRGTESVELTVVWSITLIVAGIPPITDIEPLEYGATAGFDVRSARTVLVES